MEAEDIANARAALLAEQHLPAGTLPSENDPWVQEAFRRPDGSFDAAAYNRWLEEEEKRLLRERTSWCGMSQYDIWMSAWLGRLVTEANMFSGGMAPLLPSYYPSYDVVPWEDWYLWGVISEIEHRRLEEVRSRANKNRA